jgi:hypothetical protein
MFSGDRPSPVRAPDGGRSSLSVALISTHLESKDEGLGSKLKALFGRVSLTISKPAPGTESSGKIAVTDDLTDPKLQLAPVLEKVVENGFLLGLEEG